MFSLRSSLPTLALLGLAVPVLGQTVPTAIDAPQALIEPLGLTGGTVQRLALGLNDRKPFSATILLDGVPRTLDVEPNSLRSSVFEVRRQRADGGWDEVEPPAETTYRGTVRGAPDSLVAVTLFEGQLSGTVMIDDETWAIEPVTHVNPTLPRTAHIVYATVDIKPVSSLCGVDQGFTRNVLTNTANAGAASNAEIFFLVTRAFRNLYGGEAGAINQVNTIQNTVNAVYNRDVGINNVIRGIFFGENFTNSSNALNQFAALGRRFPGYRRDLAQALMGNPSVVAPLGIAYLGTVCNTNYHYSVTWNNFNLTVRIVTSAHEMGHSWNAPHCSGGGCWIMCAGVGGCGGLRTQFGTSSINRIVSFRNTRGCLN